MANRKGHRSFGSIRKLPSGRYHVRYTGPDGSYNTAPRTFAAKIDAEAYLVDRRREIEAKLWNPAAVAKPERVTFAAYATGWLATRQVAGRPIKARTREHYTAILDDHLLPTFGDRQIAGITPKDVRDWHAATLTDRPTMRSHAYSLLRTIMASAVIDELYGRQPVPHRRRGPDQTGPQGPARVGGGADHGHRRHARAVAADGRSRVLVRDAIWGDDRVAAQRH
jgi:hypothetical protein